MSSSSQTPSPRTHKYSLNDLIRGRAYEAVERRLHKYPEQATIVEKSHLSRDQTMCFPLHIICRQPDAPIPTIRALIQAAPEALNSQDSASQQFPVQVACRYGLPADATLALMDGNNTSENPQNTSLTQGDIDGNTALHLASMYASPETVLAVLSADPSVSSKLNKHQQTPLHTACLRRDISSTVLLALLKSSPASSQRLDWQNRLPLHVACQNMANTDILSILLEAFPEGCLKWDRQYLTPYGIFRVRFHVSTQDERCQLLRRYMQRACPSPLIKARNVIQFRMEDVRSVAEGKCKRQLTVAPV